MVTTQSFCLIDEPWIPILRLDGRFERVGIRVVLTEAARIRQLAATNPMDNVALLRFLLAVLYWCEENPPQKVPGGRFPSDWFSKLDDNKDCFNLLGDGKRFYQEKNILDDLLKAKQKTWDDNRKKAKSNKAPKRERPTSLDRDDYRPIGDLLVEFPTETKIAHLRHVRDKQYGLCPACCALGIIRFSTFANAYGGGRYTAAVNGPTPTYVLAVGATLLDSLMLNWPTDVSPACGQPGWLSNKAPASSQLNALVVFSWRSRTLWLGDCGGADEICSYCGERVRLIRELAFSGNWKPPFMGGGKQKKFWDCDPHLVLEQPSAKDGRPEDDPPADDETAEGPKSRKTKSPATIGFPPPGASCAAHSRFWRRALLALSAKPPDPQHGSRQPIVVAGPAANKGLYQDATSLALHQPSADDVPDLAGQSKSVESLLGALRSATLNPKRKHPERKAALDALSSSLEAKLRGAWNGGNFDAKSYERLLQCVTETVVSSTTPGSPLRRREALHNAREAARRVIEQATQSKTTPDAAAPPRSANKKRSSRKETKA